MEETIYVNSDKIFLRDHVIALEIGAFAEERGNTQRLAFSVDVDVRGGAAGDDVDKILSYDEILAAIGAEIENSRVDLLETLAEGIAARILVHDAATRVMVRIEKLDRVSGRLGVEIVRTGSAHSQDRASLAQPNVFCLANGAELPDLGQGPNLIAVEGMPNGLPDDDALASRRIALLAAEQAAWALAGTDETLSVIATRTELDHAFRTRANVLWAPSKLVFDAGGGEKERPRDFAALCGWLAREVNAASLTFVGRDAPADLVFKGPVNCRNAT